jgi:MFS family permease
MSQRKPRFFYGYHIVAACFFILFLCWGMVLNTFPIFVKPMATDMNWGRGALSLALLMGSVGSALAAPVAGTLMDRIGARSVMATGAALIGAGLLAGSRVGELWQLYIVFALIGCGLMCSTAIPCSLVISNWFVSRRGTAMGVAFSGTSVGGMVMAPVANWIILNGSWRMAFVVSGVTILVLAIPLILLAIRTHPSEIGVEPYRLSGCDEEAEAESWGVSLRSALSLSVFWKIAAIMFIIGLVTSGLGTHCVAYLTDVGHSPTNAAFAWSAVMAVMVVGILASGPIADRWGARNAMLIDCALFALSILILVFARPYPVVLLFAVVYGLALGAPLVINPLLAGDYLGMRHFGAIFGVLNITATVGAAIGPVGAGVFFDIQKTYLPVFYFFAATMLAAGLVAAFLRSSPERPHAAEETRPAGANPCATRPR